MDDKVIVSNRSALVTKYGSTGLTAIRSALSKLKAADKKRGLATRVVYLDDAVAMKKLGGQAVSNSKDCRQVKAAVDAVCKALDPDYLMILGSVDVVPHQDVSNPFFKPGEDDDKEAWSDLPYACDAAYSRDPAHFIGPTRVVGRLPDLTGAKKPAHLLGLLAAAAAYTRRPLTDYPNGFGLSAAVWQGSTRMSLDHLFGSGQKLHLSPFAGPDFPGGELKSRTHFINCHGSDTSPVFVGQIKKQYPVALTSASTVGQIAEGTVAAVECCFGAQLYDSVTLGLDQPICQSYLQQKAYAYWGSTTIAYGPADDNAQADLICRFFLESVRKGASIGRAALEARQQFAQGAAQLDPVDLKTLAQFILLGDPSVHPIAASSPTTVPKSAQAKAERAFRTERREKLKSMGGFLLENTATASKASRPSATKRSSSALKATLARIAGKAGLDEAVNFTTFDVRPGSAHKARRSAKTAKTAMRYHLSVAKPKGVVPQGVLGGIAVVAKEVGGQVVGFRVYHQR
jgi:Peptidase family C25